MDQAWFEMKNIRQSDLTAKAWIPLRSAQCVECEGTEGSLGFREDRTSTWSLAVPTENRSDAFSLKWDDPGMAYDHTGCVVDGQYVPADVYKDDEDRFVGVFLVLKQRGCAAEQPEWHLHQDIVVTLGLKREGDKWVRPEQDNVEVARLRRASDGAAELMEIRASHIRDYLCARGMGLLVSSFRSRSEIVDDATHVSWVADDVEEKDEHNRWVGQRMAIYEGAHPYGGAVFVLHARRTDVNPEDDVPVLGDPTDANLESRSWTREFSGRRLFRISGELWRTEWLEPAAQSPIVRRDNLPSRVSFIIDAEGKRATGEELTDPDRWLWFRPEVIPALLERRGTTLTWYTRDTGNVRCASGYDVHFGIDAVGFVNVFARDVALLPEWRQRIWAAHNVSPEGKQSKELRASQIDGIPASTYAPEAMLPRALDRIQDLAQAKLQIKLRRQHPAVADLIPCIHRFRTTHSEGLPALARDLARITADDLDAKALQTIEVPPKNESWNSLKSLEKVLATKIDPADARKTVGPLAGVYQLRSANAHLPSNDLDASMKLAGVDAASPPVIQGYQLVDSAVAALHAVAMVIDENW